MTIEAYLGMATVGLAASVLLADAIIRKSGGKIAAATIFAFFTITAIIGSLA